MGVLGVGWSDVTVVSDVNVENNVIVVSVVRVLGSVVILVVMVVGCVIL